MERHEFERDWSKLKKALKEKWKELKEEDFREVHGNYEQFIAKLQEKYDYSKEQAEEEIRDWSCKDINPPKCKKMWATPEEKHTKPEKKRKAG